MNKEFAKFIGYLLLSRLYLPSVASAMEPTRPAEHKTALSMYKAPRHDRSVNSRPVHVYQPNIMRQMEYDLANDRIGRLINQAQQCSRAKPGSQRNADERLCEAVLAGAYGTQGNLASAAKAELKLDPGGISMTLFKTGAGTYGAYYVSNPKLLFGTKNPSFDVSRPTIIKWAASLCPGYNNAVVGRINGRSECIGIDIGSPASSLSSNTASATRTQIFRTDGLLTDFASDIGQANKVQLHNVMIRHLFLVVMPRKDTGRTQNLLGLNSIMHFKSVGFTTKGVTIDNVISGLHCSAALQFSTSSLPAIRGIMLTGSINGTAVHLIADSGFNGPLLLFSRRLVNDRQPVLGYALVNKKATGNRARTAMYRVSFSLMGNNIGPTLAPLVDRPFANFSESSSIDGLVGLPVLERLGITFDFANRKICTAYQ
ncbi:hypothetical protein [Metallibacterium scheffleri]|uniref:hypothetical protein n=1 Tax=Metallibacterium scheffleri TaxID=993689 RepID=UPI0010A03550|nr:hypothetical protein [Metallibacterium scheffleri]